MKRVSSYLLLLILGGAIAGIQAQGKALTDRSVSGDRGRAGHRSYEVAAVKDPVRKAWNIDVSVRGKAIQTIKLPSPSAMEGFELKGVVKTKRGFEINIRYGTGWVFEKSFGFIFLQGKFYFAEIYQTGYDKENPGFAASKIEDVEPRIPLTAFNIESYLSPKVLN